MIDIALKQFQEQAIEFLLNTSETDDKELIVLHAPTGSGKTIILISYIEQYLDFNKDTVFCWFCPGKGNLETQSKEKMLRFAPQLNTGDIDDVLRQGFKENTTYFINWEKITKKDNIAISESERTNLFEHIAKAHNKGMRFMCIIDEEHLNDTSKANDIIKALASKHEIRVSATPIKRAIGKLYSIDEVDVINEGLITRAMYINEDLQATTLEGIVSETNLLIERAAKQRQEIADEYKKVGEEIRPLVLIQFPNLNDELIEQVENKLEQLGYTYRNGMVASWFSAETKEDKSFHSKKLGKINIGDEGKENYITNNNAEPIFLLFKQALATGWDCPRAKILVKLRENMSENFEIQTLGRLRRMPMAHHYDNRLLDNAFLYTFDEKYKLAALNAGAYETQRLFLKDKAKRIELVKETMNRDFSGLGSGDVAKKLSEFIKKKYKLGNVKKENRKILENNGFIIGEEILSSYLTGVARTFKDLETQSNMVHETIAYKVDTHAHGRDLRQQIDSLKKYTGLNYLETRKVLERIFRKTRIERHKLIALSTKEFYAFILNNRDLIRDMLIEYNKETTYQLQLEIEQIKRENFKIPLEEHYRYIPDTKNLKVLDSNVYEKYTTAMIDGRFRSTSERLFERYCEQSDKIKHVYKNGDKGSQYLSIVYQTNYNVTRLFYPDYIVELHNGDIWLIETKGGESKGQDKNIDIMVEHKFKEFKRYAHENNYNFAFVRDMDEELYFNNTEYRHSLKDNEWKPITEIF